MNKISLKINEISNIFFLIERNFCSSWWVLYDAIEKQFDTENDGLDQFCAPLI